MQNKGPQYLNPMNPVAFKKVFASPQNTDVLIAFLNEMLDFQQSRLPGYPKITQLTLEKSVQRPEMKSDDPTEVNLLCIDQDKNHYIVQTLFNPNVAFTQRLAYNASRTFGAQQITGQDYSEVKRVFVLTLAEFIMFPKRKSYLSHHANVNLETHESEIENSLFTVLELPKFKLNQYELRTKEDRWIYFLNSAQSAKQSDLPSVTDGDHLLHKGYLDLNQFSWSQEQLMGYDRVEKRARDALSTLNDSNLPGLEEGRKAGLQETTGQLLKKLLRFESPIQSLAQTTRMKLGEIGKLT